MRKDLPHLAPHIQAGLKTAYKYYRKMDNTNGYVLAMRKHLHDYIFSLIY
jgi:hypothetical protein